MNEIETYTVWEFIWKICGELKVSELQSIMLFLNYFILNMLLSRRI